MAGPKFIFGNQSLYTLGTSSIRIILPEDRNCHCPDVQGYCHCAVRTGGNSLAGEVEVRQPGEGRFRVEVEFEGNKLSVCSHGLADGVAGFCRTWSENSQSGVMSDQSVNKSEIRVSSKDNIAVHWLIIFAFCCSSSMKSTRLCFA